MKIYHPALLSLVSALALSACGGGGLFGDKAEKPLEGERMSVYDFEKTLRSDPNIQFGLDGSEEQNLANVADLGVGGVDSDLMISEAWVNSFWPQVGGYPNHSMKNIAFNPGQPKRMWSSSIGDGGSINTPLTASPVIADGKVFTLDTDSNVVATDANTGKRVWRMNVRKAGEDESVIGGGVAYSSNMIFVTNGFDELVALNAKNGGVVWRAPTRSPIRGAPSVVPGRVFVVTMDNRTLAFDTTSGQQVWSHSGLNNDAGVLGASSPAIDKNALITAYSSGEIYALRLENGQELWSENLAPVARVAGQMQLADIRALPVADGGTVYATSHSNRVSAIDIRTGLPQWSAAIGSTSTPWVSGNRLFIIGLDNSMLSMDRATGQIVWRSQLARYEDEEDREDPITWQGPMMVEGRLMIFGSNGEVQDINPEDGSVIRAWDATSDLTLSPAIANGTLYMVDNKGTLSAWR